MPLLGQSLEPGEPPHRRAYLPPVEVMRKSTDECADVFNVPKVALLFLTKGNLPHDSTWRLWLKSAEGVVPVQALSHGMCALDTGSEHHAKVTEAAIACRKVNIKTIGDEEYQNQHLFSIYIHAPPTFKGFDPLSLWHGKLIKYRVQTAWGAHSLVEATRHLLWEAYRDPLNNRFLLLSESDIPLYDPLTLYQQVQSEENSRLDTCLHEGISPWRWHPKMETDHIKFHNWRKSPQWMSMTRSHAKAALEDTEVYRMFERHCWSAWDTEHSRWHRDCFSDEHYFPTLLSTLGRDDEGVCQSRGLSYTLWEEGSAHPRAFRPGEVTERLIRKAREAPKSATGKDTEMCDWKTAQNSAKMLFIPTERVTNDAVDDDVCSGLTRSSTKFWVEALPSTCFLTARKFEKETQFAVKRLFLDCDSDLSLLTKEVCLNHGGDCQSFFGRLKKVSHTGGC